MRLPPRAVRRALAPVLLGLEAALLALFAAGTVVGLLLAPLTRRRRPLRICAFAVGYLCIDAATVAAAFGLWVLHARARRSRGGNREWMEANRRLLGWALGTILAWAEHCGGFRVVEEQPAGLRWPAEDTVAAGVDVAGVDAAPLGADIPVLVLARHGGPGDSFALVHLLLEHYRRGVRIVLKEVLQADPALDILLNRLGCCFLPSSSGAGDDLSGRLADLAGTLVGRDTLLVFPEGGNWTPRRHHRAIRRLRADGKAEAANAAVLMTHVLPPRPAGVLAVLDAHPELPVVLVAHAGLDLITSAAGIWRALPLSVPMTVRAWPASPFPTTDGEERLAWLTTEWAVVDEWIDRHRASPGAPA